MKRSISLPVKPLSIEELPPLERSEEREELYESENYPSNKLLSNTSDFNPFELIKEDEHLSHVDFEVPQHEKDPQAYFGRVIAQSGQHRVTNVRIPGQSWQYFKDLITTLIEQKWLYTFAIFLSTFFLTWIVFTGLWYLVAYSHGDLDYDEQTGEYLSKGQKPCVIGARSLTSLFIYTVETLVTIGFGEKYPSEDCPEGVFLFVSQLIVYIGIEGAMVGIVFAKVARPTKEVAKAKFSKKAVICQRDGNLCLVIRVCDRKGQQSIGTKIRLSLLEDKKTKEGEYLGKCSTELTIQDGASPFILWPTTICHLIDRKSPFYKYSREDFRNNRYEIVISLTGGSPSTGQTTESRTSYLPNEIYWGECFVDIIQYNASRNIYTVDYDNFHSTTPVTISPSSAFDSLKSIRSANRKKYSIK